MVNERRARTTLAFLPVAGLAGVVVGHALAYVATFPAATSREAILAETGHSYWAIAQAMAVVCALVATIGTIARHIGHGVRHSPPLNAWAHYRSAALRLGALQSAIFVVQETLERLHSGAPVSGMLHDGLVFVGIAMQIVVAAVLALILTALSLTGRAIGRALARARTDPRTTSQVLECRSVFVRVEPAARADRTRAPPVCLLATV